MWLKETVWVVGLGLRLVLACEPVGAVGMERPGASQGEAGEGGGGAADSLWIRVRLEGSGLAGDKKRAMERWLALQIQQSLEIVRRPINEREVLIQFIDSCGKSYLESRSGRRWGGELKNFALKICAPPKNLSSLEAQDWRSLFLHEVGHRILADWFANLQNYRSCAEVAVATRDANIGSECREKFMHLSDSLDELFADVYSNAATGRPDGIYQALQRYAPDNADLLNRSFHRRRVERTQAKLDVHDEFAETRAALGTVRGRDPRALVLATYQAVRETMGLYQRDPLLPFDYPKINREFIRRIEHSYNKLTKK